MRRTIRDDSLLASLFLFRKARKYEISLTCYRELSLADSSATTTETS